MWNGNYIFLFKNEELTEEPRKFMKDDINVSVKRRVGEIFIH